MGDRDVGDHESDRPHYDKYDIWQIVEEKVRQLLRDELEVRFESCEPWDSETLGMVTREIVVYLGDEEISRRAAPT